MPRIATLMFACCLLFAMTVLGVAELLLGFARLPDSPLNAGWSSAASIGFIVFGLGALFRSSRYAVHCFGMSALILLAIIARDRALWLMPWALTAFIIAALASMSLTLRRIAERRVAIHDRIDEEIIDTSTPRATKRA